MFCFIEGVLIKKEFFGIFHPVPLPPINNARSLSSCRHWVNSEMLLDSVTLTSRGGFTSTLLDQLLELFNQFSPFIVRLSTVKSSAYQSIGCFHFSVVVSTNIDQLCIVLLSTTASEDRGRVV